MAKLDRIGIRALHLCGWLLIVSGVAHLGVFSVSGGSWEGDVSLRKPILFGFSAGVTMLSIGWLAPKLRRRWSDTPLWLAFSLAMLAEVSLITFQQWRGVPSHFNRSTPMDSAILNVIEVLILFVTIVIGDLTWRSFRGLQTSSDMALAIQGGMVLLFIGCLLGIFSAVYGTYQMNLGNEPGIYGTAGVVKFAHGMPLHAIQFFPLIVWLLAKRGVAESERLRATRFAIYSLASLTLFSCVQTFSGRSRFDVSLVSGVILLIAAAFFVAGPVASFAFPNMAKVRQTIR